MGGVGVLGFTGLGSLLGAGADAVYDPVLVQGLQVTEQAITHVAGGWHVDHSEPLSFSSARNAELWADWVRASLYITDFMRDLDWTVCSDAGSHEDSITLGYRTRSGSGENPWCEPAPPTSFYKVVRPDIEVFEDQLRFMRNYLDQRPDRTAEIISQLGFPTPYFMMILGLQAAPNRYTLELITITQVLAAHVAMIVKHHLACRRPDKLGAKVMPFIPTPAHASFPSAHSTESFAVAELLKGLIYNVDHYQQRRKRRRLLNKLAERIAVNRTVAGLHYPVDTWAGAILGRAVGQIVLSKCGAPRASVDAYEYRAKGDMDFFVDAFVRDERYDQLDPHADDPGKPAPASAAAHGTEDDTPASPLPTNGPPPPGIPPLPPLPLPPPDYGFKLTGSLNVHQSGLFKWLWDKATYEFQLVRGAL